MVEKRYTQEEQEQYEAVVDEIAEFGMTGGTSEQVKHLIQQVESQNLVNEDLKERLYRDVQRKIDEMRQKAQNDQEKKVLEEYQGYVKAVDGKYRPTGVDQKFKVHVRPEASWSVSDLKEHGYEGKTTALYVKGMWWKMGNIFDRTFGQTVDGDSFHKIIEDAEVANEQVEVLMRELALLKAAQKSITDLMGMTAAGFMTRVRSRGITSIVGASLDSTGDFFGGMSDKYFGKDRKRLKQVSVTIAKKTMEMKEKQAVRDAALKKMEELRGSGRELFDKAFKPEVDVLLDQKDKMRPTEYEKKVKVLRAKVEKWGQKTGFVHMSIFLDEAMGVTDRGEEEFISPVEIKQRRALVSRFVLDCTGKAPAPNEVQELMDGLKANQPDVLNAIYANKIDPAVVMTLQVLYRGEYKDIKLVESRRATFTTEGFMKNLVYSREYAKVAGAALADIFKTFADKWQGVSANEFDDKFDLILRGRKPNEDEAKAPESEKKDSEKIVFIKNLWREVTDEVIGEKSVKDLYEKLEKDTEFKNNYQRVFKNMTKRKLLGVVFRGVYNRIQWVITRKKFLDPTVDNFIKALHLVDDWVEEVTSNKNEIQYVLRTFGEHEDFKGMSFTDLTKDKFREILDEGKRIARSEVEKGGIKPGGKTGTTPAAAAAAVTVTPLASTPATVPPTAASTATPSVSTPASAPSASPSVAAPTGAVPASTPAATPPVSTPTSAPQAAASIATPPAAASTTPPAAASPTTALSSTPQTVAPAATPQAAAPPAATPTATAPTTTPPKAAPTATPPTAIPTVTPPSTTPSVTTPTATPAGSLTAPENATEGYMVLANALGFRSSAAIDRAKKLYKGLFEGKPDLEDLLKKNLAKVRFFITGRFKGLDFSSNKLNKTDNAIKALVKILPLLDGITTSDLKSRISRYFGAIQITAQGAEAMLNFIKSLKK